MNQTFHEVQVGIHAPRRGELGGGVGEVSQFDPAQGLEADVQAVPWVKLGISPNAMADWEAKRMQEKAQSPEAVQDQNLQMLSLIEDFNAAQGCGSPSMDKLVERLIREPSAAALIHQIYSKAGSSIYPIIGRCVAKKMRRDLEEQIDRSLEDLKGCFSPATINSAIQKHREQLNKDLLPKFERMMMAKDFGVDGLVVPLPSDLRFAEVGQTNIPASYAVIGGFMGAAFNAYLTGKIKHFRMQCAKAFSPEEEESVSNTLMEAIQANPKPNIGPRPDAEAIKELRQLGMLSDELAARISRTLANGTEEQKAAMVQVLDRLYKTVMDKRPKQQEHHQQQQGTHGARMPGYPKQSAEEESPFRPYPF